MRLIIGSYDRLYLGFPFGPNSAAVIAHLTHGNPPRTEAESGPEASVGFQRPKARIEILTTAAALAFAGSFGVPT